jgi:hypothetical protein
MACFKLQILFIYKMTRRRTFKLTIKGVEKEQKLILKEICSGFSFCRGEETGLVFTDRGTSARPGMGHIYPDSRGRKTASQEVR